MSQNPGNEDKRPSGLVQSTWFAFKVLDHMTSFGKPVRLTELSDQMNEPKAKVHRYLISMRALGIVEQEKTSDKYRLGWKLFQLGQAALDQFDLKAVAAPFMAALRDETSQSVMLAVPSGGEAMIIHNLDFCAPGVVRIAGFPGSVAPATASAQGRIMLAFADAKQQSQLISPPLKSYSPKTIVDPDIILARLERIRSDFYETAFEEITLGIATIAAPIFNEENQLIGTVGIVGSIQYLSPPQTDKIISQVQACAAAISNQFNSNTYSSKNLP